MEVNLLIGAKCVEKKAWVITSKTTQKQTTWKESPSPATSAIKPSGRDIHTHTTQFEDAQNETTPKLIDLKTLNTELSAIKLSGPEMC